MAAKALIIRTAGTNCDLETEFALRKAGAETELIHINHLKKTPDKFSESNILIIPGGFSYGDDLGAGRILGNELVTRLKASLQDFVKAGKLIIGICNGFQVLVQTGLLPAINIWEKEATLTINDSHKFEDRWVYLKGAANRSEIIHEDDFFYLPVAHAEGKFVCKNDDMYKQLRKNGQILFRYSDAEGKSPDYPANPNGSIDNIAGICDPAGKVIGMMPHPERHCLPHQHPAWTRDGACKEADGALFFKRAVGYAKGI